MQEFMRFYVWLIIVLFFSFLFDARSQFTIRTNLTVNDGLPSSRVYDIVQDSSSYIWFATENGVSRYDGFSFKNYTTRDGLPDNSTLKLYLDYKGRIWISSYEGYISYFENDTIQSHWMNDSIDNFPVSFFDYIYVDTNDNIFLSPFFGGVLYVNSKNRSIELTRRTIKKQPPYWQMVLMEELPYGTFCASVLPEAIETDKLKILFPRMKQVMVYNDNKFFYQHKHIIKTAENKYIVSLGPTLSVIVNDTVQYTEILQNDIVNLYIDSQRNVWISEKFKGVKMYPQADLSSAPTTFLENNTVSAILEDHEGNYWFCTTENGVYIVPSIQFRNYDKNFLGLNSQVILKLQHKDDDLFFSASNKGFYKAKIINGSPEIVPEFSIPGEFESEIFDFLISSQGNLMIPCSENFKYDFYGNPLPFNMIYGRSAYAIFERHDGQLILGLNSGISYADQSGHINHSKFMNYMIKTLAIGELTDSILVLGTIKGLIYNRKNEFIRADDSSHVLNSRITSVEIQNGKIWVGTFGHGLAVIENGEINFISSSSGLSSNRVKTIFPENDSTVWVGTNNGLDKISFIYGKPFEYVIDHYSIFDGLSSNEINDISKIGNDIWLATDKGLASFNPLNLKLIKHKPKLILENVIMNQEALAKNKNVNEFKHNENNFTFSFKVLSYKDPKKITYIYNLAGFEPDWIETSSSSVRYSNLGYGNYTFNVKAKINDGPESDILSYRFTVQKHFTETIAFRIFLIVLLAGLLGYIIYAIINHFRKREELKRHVLLAEQKAVRSQMNPHFIFNSLNSIQNFILDHDSGNANLYLSNFSSLIRRILESSKNNFSSLREELDTLKLYLDLEKLRFEGQFDYEISIDSAIRPELVTIPSMILQPFLENAIWHGIMPKNSKGKIDLKITPANSDKILICIEDNGIGRKNSTEIGMKRRHHKPTGIKNIQERLILLNRLNKSRNSIRIVDLFDQHQKAAGTRVELELEI